MNKQLTLHSGSHIWRLDTATRRRGHQGVASARKVLQESRSGAATSANRVEDRSTEVRAA